MYFDILKKELKNTASSMIADNAVCQVEQNLQAAAEFEFRLEQRKCEITTSSEHPKE